MMKVEHGYKLGDHIRIKEWGDMVSQYGCDPEESAIRVPFKFTKSMRKLCGGIFEIQRILDSFEPKVYVLKEAPAYNFSEEMFVGKVEKLEPKDKVLEFNEELI